MDWSKSKHQQLDGGKEEEANQGTPVESISVIPGKLRIESSRIDGDEDSLNESQLDEHWVSKSILDVSVDQRSKGYT